MKLDHTEIARMDQLALWSALDLAPFCDAARVALQLPELVANLGGRARHDTAPTAA